MNQIYLTMKTQIIRTGKAVLFAGFLAGFSINVEAQTVSTFENLTLATDTFWDGSDMSGGFTDGDAYFYNTFDTTYPGYHYWSEGWAYTNMRNDSVGDYTNMYSAVTATGVNGSSNYVIGKDGSQILLLNSTAGSTLNGVYITNTTYADSAMAHGDSFSKKFGGSTGDDADWFKLTIDGYLNNTLTDSVEFYLADYRFTNNIQDYIVDSWTWVDLSDLNNVDSLVYRLSSSDNGQWGMNTPAFFAMDNFNGSQPVGIQNKVLAENNVTVYPNPAENLLNLNLGNRVVKQLTVTDYTGKIIISENQVNASVYSLNVSELAKGFYLVNLFTEDGVITKKFVKK